MKTLLDKKTAIHCPTKELAEKVLKVLHEDGYVWQSRDSLLNKSNWEEYRSETVYLTENSWINYGMKTGYTRDMNYTIIPAEEFLERVGLPERWKVRRTIENSKVLSDWANRVSSGKCHSGYGKTNYIHSHDIDTSDSPRSGNHPDYTEITYEQFKKHILKPMKYKLKVEYPGSPKVGTITEEDMSKYPDFWEIVKETFKEGDWVTCLPGFSNSGIEGDSKYGGAGYQSNLVFKVKKVVNHSKYDVLWIPDRGTGVYNHVVRKATQEEIDAATKIEIAGYTLERVGSEYKFGCQTFSKQEVKTIKRLLESPINAEITIGGTKITQELINKL